MPFRYSTGITDGIFDLSFTLMKISLNVSQVGDLLPDSLSKVNDDSFFTHFLRVFIKSRVVINL